MKKLIAWVFVVMPLSGIATADEQVVAVAIDELRANPTVLESHRYISTGQPDAALLAQAKAAGYAAVIDLRTAAEDRGMDEAAEVEAAGLTYHSLPVDGAKGTTFANARVLQDMLAGIDGPVLLHCRSGNRVGALLALTAAEAGASLDEALDIGRKAGLTTLEPIVIERLTSE